jgi:WD40 repeat protein
MILLRAILISTSSPLLHFVGNKLISVGGDKKGYFFDGKTGEKIGELDAADGHTLGIYSAAWSPDNKLVLTVSADKTAKLWDAETYKCTKTFKLGNDTEDQQLGCLWNGNELLTVSLSGNINVLDIDNPEKPKKIIRGHNKLITALAYDPVARTLFSADFGGKVLQWNNETGEATEFSGAAHKNQVSAIRVNGDNLYTISMDDSIKISSISSKQWGNSVDLGVQPTGLDVAKSDGQFVVVVAGENVIVLRNGSIVSKEKLKFFANAVAVNPSATEVAIGGKDNKIHVYTVSGNSLTPKTEYAQHRGEVTALSYSHDGSLLASADSNREVLVWRNGKAEISGWVFHTTGIKSLSWSSDNDHVASVGTDGNLIVWSVSNPTVRIQQKNAHPGGINAVVFLDNNTVATAGQDSVVKTWTLKF